MILDANWTIAILTGVLVFVTGWYAWITNKMLVLSGQQHEATLRPYITVQPYIKEGTQLVCIKIANLGKSTAENVKITPLEDFFRRNDLEQNIKKLPIFNSEVEGFPPGSEVVFSLGMFSDVFHQEAINPDVINFTCEYRYFNSSYSEKHVVDFRHIRESTLVESLIATRLQKIQEELVEIRKSLFAKKYN